MQEPIEGGLPLGELWFDVIPRFAADIRAGYQAEFGIDVVRLFAALAAAWRRHCATAPSPAPSGAPSQPDIAAALRRRGLLWDWTPEAVPSRPPPRTTPWLFLEPDWPPLQLSEPPPRYTGPPEPPPPSPETVRVRQDIIACLANGSLLAFGHPDRGGPRQQIEADWWAGPPWRVKVAAKRFIWLGTQIGQRPRMWGVLIYRDRSNRLLSGRKPVSGRKPDPRNKCAAMIDGLEKALAAGALTDGSPATLKAAHKAMLGALGCKAPPAGMGDDAFAKHCKPWLKEHGIYG